MQSFQKILVIPLMLLLAAGFSNTKPSRSDKKDASDSVRLVKAMRDFRLEEGLRIELVAAEPLVVDPVAFAFDEYKRLYVVEDRGYPDPADGGNPTNLGRIALLEDRDGDGNYEHRSEFASGFTYPNGVLVWKGGVFVTCAPDIYYLKDTNGDGVADVRQVVLTGFNADRTAQIRVSHPTLGLDGWIYLTSGLNNGKVRSPLHPEREAVSFSASDSRFHPETLEFEVTGGRSQFGLTFDAYGRRFGCSNRHPVQQIVLEPWYLRRNPNLLFTETTQNVSKVEAEAVVFPISGAITSADFIPKLIGLSHSGTFTSASGVTVFNGSGLTTAHQGNVFICESAQNLVQRQVMVPEGVTYKSELPYRGREFLSSVDEWFRPVFLQGGPEGALYLADMHRKVIDHPSYVPEEARGELDFESGKNDGRIYRIVRKGFQAKGAVRNSPAQTQKPDLIRWLQSKEEWERQTAHRLILEKGGTSLVSSLLSVARSAPLPESRVRALWLLNSLDVLDKETVKAALADKVGGVREQAVLLAGNVLDQYPVLLADLLAKVQDTEKRVRFNTALVLGNVRGEKAITALAKVAAKDGAERWVRAAVLSGIDHRLAEFLLVFRAESRPDPGAYSLVMQDLGLLFGNSATVQECRQLLREMIRPETKADGQIATVVGLLQGMSRGKSANDGAVASLSGLLGTEATSIEKQNLDRFLDRAMAVAATRTQPVPERIIATALLGFADYDKSYRVLEQLTDARNAPELQLEAVAALTRLGDLRGVRFLTQRSVWTNYTPRVKSAVIASLVARPTFIPVLFDAIGGGTIKAAEITSTDRQRLMKHREEAVSNRARELFAELEGGGRMKVYEDHRSILTMDLGGESGRPVFDRACSSCHTYAGAGGKVGPDLTGVRNQPADALLLHILVPNYEVLPAYQAITVETSDGKSLSGWLMAETESSLTFKTSFGTQESILRKNIKSLSHSGLSLMPDGLEQTMTKIELARLIAFLKTGR